MIRIVFTLNAAPGRRQDLVDHYREHRILDRSMPFGSFGGEIAVPLDQGRHDQIVVTSLWDDRQHYRAWLDSSERVAVIADMSHLLAADESGSIEYLTLHHTTPDHMALGGRR